MKIWQHFLKLFQSSILTTVKVAAGRLQRKFVIGVMVMVLIPLSGRAQFFDDFTADASLNTNLWTTPSPVLIALARNFNSALVVPTLSFNEFGMTLSGVNKSNELAGVQSLVAYAPPFTLTTTVTAEQAHGNAFELFLVTEDQSEWINVAGNLNPGNGSFFGVWVNYDHSGLPYLSLGNDLYSDPGVSATSRGRGPRAFGRHHR